MATKYIKIRLNLDKEIDRRVYEYLDSCNVSLCRAAVSALYDHTQRLEEDAFLDRVIRTIQTEVQKANALTSLVSLLQQPAVAVPAVNESENEDTISEFLEAFN